MFNRQKQKASTKMFTNKNKRRSPANNPKSSNEIKSAFEDDKKLKRNRKRLNIGWFFRPD
jgi:hypothetical protein